MNALSLAKLDLKKRCCGKKWWQANFLKIVESGILTSKLQVSTLPRSANFLEGWNPFFSLQKSQVPWNIKKKVQLKIFVLHHILDIKRVSNTFSYLLTSENKIRQKIRPHFNTTGLSGRILKTPACLEESLKSHEASSGSLKRILNLFILVSKSFEQIWNCLEQIWNSFKRVLVSL